MIRYIFILFIFLYFGCAKNSQEEKLNISAKTNNVFKLNGVKVKDGFAPNFDWIDNSGKTNSLNTFNQKLTLINFWATWCSPCKKELPDLISINDLYKDKGVKVLGISIDRGSNVIGKVSDFVNEHKITYPIIIDNGELSKAFGNVRGIPSTFFVDENMKIVETIIGIRSKDFFIAKINSFLK